jgi:2-keto-4-pentenoate hydratase/2-oxohepta-3-ene-1,7-dioic acid hydratase in catechol pathway
LKLVTIADERGGRPGLIYGNSIFDLRAGHPALSLANWRPDSVVAVMDAGQSGRDHLQRLRDALEAANEAELQELRRQGCLLPLAGTRLGPPIRRSGLMVSLEQDQDGLPRPFIKSANTLVGPDEQVLLPKHLGGTTTVLAQVAAVLGRPGYRLSAEQAHGAVGGYLLALDFTHQTEPGQARGSAHQVTARSIGKQLPGFFPMGPCLVTAGEVRRMGALRLGLTINDVAAATWSLDDLAPRVEEALVWLSRYFSFKPGDLVAISSLDSAGAVVGPGDEICLSGADLGTLRVRIAA